jgi:hypothetical protein
VPEKSFVEQCWFLYGIRLGRLYLGFLRYHSEGTAASVDFDWEKALSPLQMGWFHSHPGVKFLTPSSRDNKTMRGWVKARAKPLLCGIFCQGEQKCYCYYKVGMDINRETIVARKPVYSRVHGSIFLGYQAVDSTGEVV